MRHVTPTVMPVMITAPAPRLPVPAAGLPADRDPAVVYLARLAPGSRRTMRQALDTVANILSSGHEDSQTLAWAALRYQHTQAVRTALAERYAPATANKMLAALRGVLREAMAARPDGCRRPTAAPLTSRLFADRPFRAAARAIPRASCAPVRGLRSGCYGRWPA